MEMAVHGCHARIGKGLPGNMSEQEDMKRRRYGLRIEEICTKYKLPTLGKSQITDLVERVMKVPGTINCIDLRTVTRLYCREMKCTTEGPIYE